MTDEDTQYDNQPTSGEAGRQQAPADTMGQPLGTDGPGSNTRPSSQSSQPQQALPLDPDAAAAPATAKPKMARKKRNTIIAVVLVLVLALAGGATWWFLSNPANNFFDPNAKTGQAPYKTPEEIQAELNRIVEEGMFNISIASVIEFENGTAPGKAYIENIPANHYNMKVAITLDDSGETVYESGGLAPGSFIEDITLTKDLDPGSYPVTATFSAIDAESLKEAGKAAAKVTLIVRG